MYHELRTVPSAYLRLLFRRKYFHFSSADHGSGYGRGSREIKPKTAGESVRDALLAIVDDLAVDDRQLDTEIRDRCRFDLARVLR